MKIAVLIFFIFSFSFVQAENKSFHVVIDPGHGGQDLGAVRDSFVESKIVLQIAEKVKAQLEAQNFIVTTLTRQDDSTVSLKDRVQLANDLKADLFVSLHANTSNSRAMTGMEFYFNSPTPAQKSAEINKKTSDTNAEVIAQIKNDFMFYDKTEKSLMLTKSFREKSTEQEQKGVIKRAPFYVVERTTMPSVLVELGFISNRREARKLASKEYQTEMAQLLTSAILEYKEKSDKLSPL